MFTVKIRQDHLKSLRYDCHLGRVPFVDDMNNPVYYLKDSVRKEIHEWIIDNKIEYKFTKFNEIEFEKEHDAVEFMLRWGH